MSTTVYLQSMLIYPATPFPIARGSDCRIYLLLNWLEAIYAADKAVSLYDLFAGKSFVTWIIVSPWGPRCSSGLHMILN